LKTTILGQMLAKEEQEGLSKLIDNSYGSPESLAKHLDMGIEMLFYIEDDTFEKRDVQAVVSAIRGITKIIRNHE